MSFQESQERWWEQEVGYPIIHVGNELYSVFIIYECCILPKLCLVIKFILLPPHFVCGFVQQTLIDRPLSGDTGCTKEVLALPSDAYILWRGSDIKHLVAAMSSPGWCMLYKSKDVRRAGNRCSRPGRLSWEVTFELKLREKRTKTRDKRERRQGNLMQGMCERYRSGFQAWVYQVSSHLPCVNYMRV